MIPPVMSAILLKGHGGLDQLEYRTDVPVPTPTHGEVLVEVGAAGLNNTDLNLRMGWYSKTIETSTADTLTESVTVDQDAGWSGSALSFPRIQGADACGRIVAVGSGVPTSRLGERVLIDPIIRDADGATRYFGSDCAGGFAAYTAVPNANACRIDSTLTDAELASFPCAYLAALNMLTRSSVVAGDRVLISGASGGVGSAAVQLAKARGAYVVAISQPAKLGAVKSLGADQVLTRDQDLIKALGSQSIDVVIDVVGGSAFASLLETLKPHGRYAVAGAIAGPVVTLDLRTLYLKDLSFFGCTIPTASVFQELLTYVQNNAVKPVISATFPLAKMAQAQSLFLEKNHTGKIVLQVKP